MFGPSLHNVLHIQSDSRRGIHQKQNAKVWIYLGWIYFENLPKWSPSPAIIVVLIGNLCLIPSSIIGRGRWPGTNGYNGVKRAVRGPPAEPPPFQSYCGGYCKAYWADTSPTPLQLYEHIQDRCGCCRRTRFSFHSSPSSSAVTKTSTFFSRSLSLS